MREHFGSNTGTVIIIHGGAGPQDPSRDGIEKIQKSLAKIARAGCKLIDEKHSITSVVSYCLKEMESDHQFNAGFGSALQADGIARLSASLMNGKNQRFSGVASASYISHPSILAEELQTRTARVLTNPGAELLARELQLPFSTNITEKRSKKWLRSLYADRSETSSMDTVGCVIRNSEGALAAGSSTGGRGFEYPGRVSDAATIAGNYASKYAAIAVTGIGEEIVDDAVAPRIETRVRDGMSLQMAASKSYLEATRRKRKYGWIALDKAGNWTVSYTTSHLPFVVLSNNKIVGKFESDSK